MPTYNKLIRDNIPDILENKNLNYKLTTLNEKDYLDAIKSKFKEELDEFFNSKSISNSLEELADILELIHAYAIFHNFTFEKIEKIRQKKLLDKGGFSKKLFLIDTS